MTNGDGGTWIDAEDLAYPAGSLRQSRRRARVMCDDGRLRIARIGIPDTYFSIPARVRANGKTVAGFVSSRDEDGRTVFVFRAYLYRKNAAAVAVKGA